MIGNDGNEYMSIRPFLFLMMDWPKSQFRLHAAKGIFYVGKHIVDIPYLLFFQFLSIGAQENLTDEYDERGRLEEALSLNKPLATAYYMKEDLRQIWNQK
ncbi:MAG: hypothetical protein U9P49_03360, partial [Thermodesulfobacteriota bacterium]|nr:hypothetical protein [Thermodesulfobacteriota bacterium]